MVGSGTDVPAAGGDRTAEGVASATLAPGATVPDEGVAGPGEPTLPALAVSALMVTKADLIAALRAYVPHLADVEMLDGERFLLVVGPDHPEPNGRPA